MPIDISRGGSSQNGGDDPAKPGDATKGGPATTGAGDGTAAQPTVGAGGGQIGGGASNASAGANGQLAGPDYYNPAEREPTSLAQLDSDEASLEAANSAYRAKTGLNLADYQKYKDNIAGWRQILGGQDEIIVTARPRTSQASVNGQVGQITATLVGKQVEAFCRSSH